MKKIQFIFIFLFMMILVSSISISPKLTTADDDGEDQNDDEDKLKDDGSHDRELQIENDTNSISLESKLKTANSTDKIEVELETHTDFPSRNDSGELEAKFSYKHEANGTEVKFKYRVQFSEIVEYRDNGSRNGYQNGEELFTYIVGGTGWAPLTWEQVNVTSIGSNTSKIVHVFNATTADGVVTVIIRVSGSIVALANSTLTPNSIKMDVIINNFPYTANDSSLAVRAKIKTGAKTEVKDETDDEKLGVAKNESSVGINVNGTQGFFSWADTAVADNVTINVITSPLTVVDASEGDEDVNEGEENKNMYYSFNATNAENIFWDPKVGVVTTDVAEVLANITAPVSTIITSTSTTTDIGSDTTTFSVTDQSSATTDQNKGSDTKSTPGFGLFISIFSVITVLLIRKKIRR